MQETITIQIGQCGNQIGNEFWNKIKEEHNNENGSDRRDKFFYSTESGKIMPRSILIDTEPRAINPDISTAFNTFLTNEGTGASNNWAHGYYLAKTHAEDMLELLSRNVEACDNVESFQLIHSCAGGTGSGFSSFLADSMRDMFPKKIFVDFAILPNNNEASDVVVQPYNTILSLNKAKSEFDMVVLMDNYALAKQTDVANTRMLTYESLNTVAADVIASFTSPLRFPKYVYSDINSILHTLVPSHDFNFIVPSIVKSTTRKFSVGEIVTNLIKQKSMLCNYETSSIYGSLAILNVLDEKLDVNSLLRSQRLIQNKINFLDLPFYTNCLTNKREVNVAFNNTTSVRNCLNKIVGQFDRLKKRNAFLENYKRFEMDLNDMDSAKENVERFVENYERVEVTNK